MVNRANTECVRVVVRCRPLSQKEIEQGRQQIVDMDLKSGQVTMRNPKLDMSEPRKSFTFDSVHDWNANQEDLYNCTALRIVENVMNGYNGTIFAYGQTGTGKTHTMEGKDDPIDMQGITPRAFRQIFEEIKLSENKEFLVRASFLEIYNEDIRDLLGKQANNRLELKESVDTGVYVKGLTSFVVKGVSEIENVLKVGKKNRTVGATLMNQDSSRSHSIFTITIEMSDKSQSEDSHIRVGKLNLVDLAGSERQSKTGASGDRLKEATKINLSLSALGNVISTLVDGRSGHIPYRDSKLTRLLQDSLGGNTKTVMVANIGPADYNYDETISTLRYANRAKNIKNKPRINEDPKDAMLREFQEEIARLKQQLASSQGVAAAVVGGEMGNFDPNSKELRMSQMELSSIKKKIQEELMADMRASISDDVGIKIRQELEEKAQKEIESINAAKEKNEEEKAKLKEEVQRKHQELREHYETLNKERKEKEELRNRLETIESRVLQGSEDLLDRTERQAALLKSKEDEVERQRQRETEQALKIAELQEERLAVEEHYSSIQEEVEKKTKKLRKLFVKYEAAKQEVQDITEEFQAEREDMLDSIRGLTQELKLKSLVVDYFIPPSEMSKITRRAHWNEDSESWTIENIDLSGNSVNALKRLVASDHQPGHPANSEYEKIENAMLAGSHLHNENMLNLELDLPQRTIYDYEGEGHQFDIQDALNYVFSANGDVVLTSNGAMGNVYLAYNNNNDNQSLMAFNEDSAEKKPKSAKRKSRKNSSQRGSSGRRPSSANGALSSSESGGARRSDGLESKFPTARGLVK